MNLYNLKLGSIGEVYLRLQEGKLVIKSCGCWAHHVSSTEVKFKQTSRVQIRTRLNWTAPTILMMKPVRRPPNTEMAMVMAITVSWAMACEREAVKIVGGLHCHLFWCRPPLSHGGEEILPLVSVPLLPHTERVESADKTSWPGLHLISRHHRVDRNHFKGQVMKSCLKCREGHGESGHCRCRGSGTWR